MLCWDNIRDSSVALSKQLLLPAGVGLFALLPELSGGSFPALLIEVALELGSELSGCVQLYPVVGEGSRDCSGSVLGASAVTQHRSDSQQAPS